MTMVFFPSLSIYVAVMIPNQNSPNCLSKYKVSEKAAFYRTFAAN